MYCFRTVLILLLLLVLFVSLDSGFLPMHIDPGLLYIIRGNFGLFIYFDFNELTSIQTRNLSFQITKSEKNQVFNKVKLLFLSLN